VIGEGMQIDRSDEQDANAEAPGMESLQPDSNVKSDRFVQLQKQKLESVSIDEEMQID
jgi:hypothetical protein